AAFFTAGCASSAPFLGRPLGPSGRASAAAVLPSAAQASRRGLKWKGKVNEKYLALLTPGGDNTGDRGAFGVVEYKVVSYSKHE
ncbi:unnamed protein product, partial [Closterium sp. Naga37s-1]